MFAPRFKPGDEVFYPAFNCGCGTVLEVRGPYQVVVDFGKNGIRPLTVTEHLRLAKEEDKNWPQRLEPEPEPICGPENATLEELEDAVYRWERAIEYIGKGWDCLEEYTLDLFNRDVLHGVINGFANRNLAVPDALKARMDAADMRFMEVTFETDSHVWGGFKPYDKTIFWYYYRWPIK